MKTPSAAARKVRVIKYVKEGDSWKFVRVTRFNNGKLKPDARPGKYYLDWIEGTRRRRSVIGPDPQEALNALRRKEHALQSISLGVPAPADVKDKRSLRECIEEFLDQRKETRSKKTVAASRVALYNFRDSCKQDYLEDITREDLQDFLVHLKKLKLADRTIANQWERLINFLKEHGVTDLHVKGPGGDAPKYVDRSVEIYEPSELEPFWKACTDDEHLLFQFFLCTGMREQEVAHFYIRDIKFDQGVFRVCAKPELFWRPKALKERDIPIAPQLVKPLQAYIERRKKKGDTCPLLFPSLAECKPEGHFLRRLHAILERDGLDLDHYWLHKFRSTFATTALRNGVDLRTVQEWMGHDDIESTMRYLKPAGGKVAQEKMAALKF
jgi:integrase/recombinase XerD